MTFDEFNKYQLKLIDEVLKMRDTKGKEYANSENRFANFDRLSQSLNLPNSQIGFIYLAKHLDSIATAIRLQKFEGNVESFEGRIIDAIVYLTLIAGMVKEKVKTPIKEKEIQDENSGKQQPFEYDPTTQKLLIKFLLP